jgi:hypothetical protein
VLSLLVIAGFCSCCFGQLPADLVLPSETLNSGSPVFQASNSITNSASFVVQNPASVTLAAGSYIRLEPGFDAAAGSAPFTFFAVIDPNVTQGPPNEGDGPPSIPFSYTAPAHSPECDNISGKWIDSDSVGNSIGWDLNQNGPSVSGTLSFDDYRDFGYGLTYCGTINYSASGVFDGNSFSLSAVNPVPSIDSCGLPLAPSETETVTLSGQACGSGNGAYTISGGGGTPALSRITPHPAGAQVSRAMNASVRPALTSGSSTWTTYSPRFNVSHSSYIPVDNIHGPTPCYFYPGVTSEPFAYFPVYKGDANRGTYRTTQAIFVVPDKQYYGNFFPNTGATRNYGFGSPANGSTLSSYPTSSDIYNGPYAGADEDNAPDDCHFWNRKGQGDVTNMQSHSVTFPGSNKAVVTLSGKGQDPLEPKFGGIQWNATITLDSTDPNNPTAQVSISHTCYPAHIIKVNGVTLLDDQPTFNNVFYLIGCLTDPTHVSWTTKTTGAIPIPSH